MTSTSDLDLQPVEGQEFGTLNGCQGCGVVDAPTHWWIGLDDQGQAHYACTNCAPGLLAVQPLMPLRT